MAIAESQNPASYPSTAAAPISLTPQRVLAIPDLTAAATPALISFPTAFNSDTIIPIRPGPRFRAQLIPVVQYPALTAPPGFTVTTPPIVQLVGISGTIAADRSGMAVDDVALLGDPIQLTITDDVQDVANTIPAGAGARSDRAPANAAPGIDLRGFPLVFASISQSAVLAPGATGTPTLQLDVRLTN